MAVHFFTVLVFDKKLTMSSKSIHSIGLDAHAQVGGELQEKDE